MTTARDVYNQSHHVRTAPFDEVNAMYRNSQRDDAEATDPELATQRYNNERDIVGFVPDGFFWGVDSKNQPLLKPTSSAINDLASQLEAAYMDDERLEQNKIDTTLLQRLQNTIVRLKRKTKAAPVMDLAAQLVNNEPVDFDKQLDGVLARLERVEQGWMVSGLVRAIGQWAAQEAASNLRWCMIHQQALYRHEDNGNESAAENSLLNFESSRNQLFVAMSIMDWAQNAGFQPDFTKAARDALGLAGWQNTQRIKQDQQANARKAVRSSTIDMLYGRLACATLTPEEVAEQEELNDDLEGVI